MHGHTAVFLYLWMFQLFRASIISGCQQNVCLMSCDVENVLTLICVVPNLYRQIIFYDPNEVEYAHCVLPFPTPHCFTKNFDSNIIQNLRTNQTILIIPRSNNNDLNGTWTCSHDSYLDKVNVEVEKTKGEDCSNCLDYELIAYISLTICIILSIAGMFFLVKRYRTASLDMRADRCEIWTSKVRRVCKMCHIGLCRVYSMVKDIEGTIKENKKAADCDDRNSLINESRELDEIQHDSNHSRCNICKKETSFSLCIDCKKLYCEICAANHIAKLRFDKHRVMQTNQYPYEKHEKLCDMCNEIRPKLICKICKCVLCTKCPCPHAYDKDNLKQLLAPSSPIIPTTRSRNQTHSEVLRKSYMVPLSNEKSVTRIRGLAFLESGLFALADCRNKRLKVFSKQTCVYEKKLDMEPRGMTAIKGNKIAVSFAYEKKIIFYEVNKNGVKEYGRFDLQTIGKPYDIASHKDHLIVELNEGVDGCIIIFDIKGEKKYQIQNDDWKFGYFTGNTIRVQLDMDKQEFYVAAIGKQAVYCLDFKGSVKWLVKVPSPRSIAIVPDTKNTTLLFASHKSSAIYKLICEDKEKSERYKPSLIEMEIVNGNEIEVDKIKLPKYIAYDHKNRLLYTEVADGHVSVYHLETPG